MYIHKFNVKNYKSFLDTKDIELSPGFNMIVGQNDVGKTALAESLSLRFINKPHRSLITVPRATTQVSGPTQAELEIQFEKKEAEDLLIDGGRTFHIPLRTPNVLQEAHRFLTILNEPSTLHCIYESTNAPSCFKNAYLVEYDMLSSSTLAAIEIATGKLTPSNALIMTQPQQAFGLYADILTQALHDRIYMFKAERLNVSKCKFGINATLDSNAANLAEVLHNLQTNTSLFTEFNTYINKIFPHIKWISVPSGPASDEVQILISSIDPKLGREDLAVPLSESGTGIGQVLAILYVVITAKHPRIIIIDEPQSFLHPGAARKLIEILKRYPQHQFIVTTHSPEIVTVANPRTFLLLRKEEFETTVEKMDISEANNLRLFLSEIGVRLSDVFGADNILWVEGSTEEQCFPLIFEKLLSKPLLGTKILGVVQTGDFEGRYKKTIFQIYNKLSKGNGLIPPAVGFIFDKEGRSERDQEDLKRQSQNKVAFLPRRMYENYLLNPSAITSIISKIEDFRENPVTAEEIEQWIFDKRSTQKYYDGAASEAERKGDSWYLKIHGAKFLEDLFVDFSDCRVNYDKIEYGIALTRWLLENEPDDLAEVARLIDQQVSVSNG